LETAFPFELLPFAAGSIHPFKTGQLNDAFCRMANAARPDLIERPPGHAGISANKDSRISLFQYKKEMISPM